MNSSELRAAVARRGTTNRELAKSLGLSESSFYNKLGGVTQFKNSEIKKLTEMLGLSMAAVNDIFFDGFVN